MESPTHAKPKLTSHSYSGLSPVPDVLFLAIKVVASGEKNDE